MAFCSHVCYRDNSVDQKSFEDLYTLQILKADNNDVAWYLEKIKCFVELTENLLLF